MQRKQLIAPLLALSFALGALPGCAGDAPASEPPAGSDVGPGADLDRASDLAADSDLGAAADVAAARDLAPPLDSATALDAVLPVDLARPADLTPPADLALGADLAAPADQGGDLGPEPDGGPPWQPPLTPEFCGAPPYVWRDPATVGRPVDFAPGPVPQVPGAQLDLLLSEAGYPWMTPVRSGVAIYYLRYTSQDRGQVVEGTAVVGVPTDLPDPGPLPVALWLHGTTGMADACAPSHEALDALVAPALLASRGYLAVAPDYLGMRGFGPPSAPGTFSHYLVAEQVALGSLDALRAALAATAADPATPAGDPARVIVLGGSQGGHAALFVDRYLEHYAPELHLLAVAAVVPPSDLLGLTRWGTSHWGPTTGALAFAIAAMHDWYGRTVPLEQALTDLAPQHIASTIQTLMSAGCDAGDVFDGLESFDQVYPPAFREAASEGRWEDLEPFACWLRANSVRTSAVASTRDVPLLTTYAEGDTLVVTEAVFSDAAWLCEQGRRVETVTCAGESHTGGARAALPYVFRWLDERAAGQDWDPARICQPSPPQDCDLLR